MDKIVIISGYNNIVKIPKKSKKKNRKRTKKNEKERKRTKISQKGVKKVSFLNYGNLNKELILLFFLIIRLTYNKL